MNEQTYGLQFVDYLPYYHLGLCYLKTGDFNAAIRMFNIEEDREVDPASAGAVAEQRENAQPDQVRRRLVAGEQEQDEHRGELVEREALVLLGVHQ